MTRPVGRPPSDDPRRNVLRARCTDTELTALTAAADRAGYSSTAAWVRDVALAKAKEDDDA